MLSVNTADILVDASAPPIGAFPSRSSNLSQHILCSALGRILMHETSPNGEIQNEAPEP
jgi:hypothetical protein